MAPLLRAAGHDVFTPTLTGFGERAHLLGPDVGPAVVVQDVVGVLECEELTGVVLVGHSFGAVVALGVADRVPGRLSRLVLLDGLLLEPAGQRCAGDLGVLHRAAVPSRPLAPRIARRAGRECAEPATGHDAMIGAPELTAAELLRWAVVR